jgi:glyoxylase-like metal-dependent hydrolase (beta-lactamase superfamily II)
MKFHRSPWLLGGLFVVALLIASAFVLFGPLAIGVRPAIDGTTLPADGRLVMDGHSNIFVLPTGRGRVALVDCGTDPQAKSVVAALKVRNLSPDAVEAIFITHGHPDHIGGCGAFKNAKLFAMAEEVGLVEGTAKVASPFRAITRPPIKATGLNVARALHDGDDVTIGNLSVKTLAMPGHTPGSAAYLVNEVLYLGDAALVTNNGTLRNADWIFSTDTAEAERSLTAISGKLANFKVVARILAPAHSGQGSSSVLKAAN